MKIKRILSFALAIFLLVACNAKSTPTPTSGPSLPAPQIAVTPPAGPDPLTALNAYLQAWKADDYASMYGMLTQESQATISADDFSQKYTDAMNNLTLKELTFNVAEPKLSADSAQINFHVTYKTNMVGDLDRDMTANMKLEANQWRITWDNGLIMPELHDGSHLALDLDVPVRGSIFDRQNKPIVSQTDAKAIGLIPQLIDLNSEGQLLASLSSLVDLYPGTIQSMYANAGADWYIPIGETSLEDYKKRGGSAVAGFPGIYVYDYNTRFYTNQVAPQTIGYVSAIQKDELNQLMRQGYARSQLIGRIGLEKWGQDILAGKNGGTLHIVSADGAIGASLGSFQKQPGKDLYLTLDETMQFYAQKGLEGFRGAIVIMERDTGKVLVMASSPGYDPNLFDSNGNKNSPNGIVALLNDQNTPSLNRAAQSKYPLGSVFKVITFSAALESGTYKPDNPVLDCPYHFTELPNVVMDDWTWSHYQNELAAGETTFTKPSGPLDLSDALKRSCNPWFWHIGKDLYEQNRVTAIADMARGFGLGAPTGIDVIGEDPGTIINPPSVLDAVNQAIGQGDVEVTPLQVARFMAAIGNGGTLYRPQLVDKIVDANGTVTQVFKPDANAHPLPMSAETLTALREAMHKVIYDIRGTAFGRFYGIRDEIPLYGKTGTAESGNGLSHAWFAGYTDSSNPEFKNIAIAVIAENAGEGSIIAAPMFRRMVYVYLHGKPGYPYPWEADYGVTRTPTIPVTPTLGAP